MSRPGHLDIQVGPLDLPRELTTERLRLRRWRDEDRREFAAMNADIRVMEYFPAPLTADESDAAATRIVVHFQDHGFGLWVVEATDVAPFVGVVGLAVPRFQAHFTPCVEIGWRLNAEHWGKGYAIEAARAALTFGLSTVGLPEIVSFTVPSNGPSRRVMEKLGMTHDPADDFWHPSLPEGDPLRRHVLYRAKAIR